MRPRHWQVTVTGDRTDTARPEAAAASESDDDLVLVQACLRGHREAFDAIVERHQRQVYQLCYRFAGNHEDASDLGERADARLLRGERAAEVRAAIAKLPKKQRAALVLRVYHDLSHDQIAEIVGTSVGAVKANFFHALANLKKILKSQS